MLGFGHIGTGVGTARWGYASWVIALVVELDQSTECILLRLISVSIPHTKVQQCMWSYKGVFQLVVLVTPA